jgi:hypothetical protein
MLAVSSVTREGKPTWSAERRRYLGDRLATGGDDR